MLLLTSVIPDGSSTHSLNLSTTAVCCIKKPQGI